jgi:hypothetical protein
MNQKNIIVILHMCDFRTECFGSLKKACIAHGWKVNTLHKNKFPFEYQGWKIQRIPFI